MLSLKLTLLRCTLTGKVSEKVALMGLDPIYANSLNDSSIYNE